MPPLLCARGFAIGDFPGTRGSAIARPRVPGFPSTSARSRGISTRMPGDIASANSEVPPVRPSTPTWGPPPYVGWGCDIIPEPAADNTVDGSMISSEHRGYVWAVGRQRLGTGGGESSTLGGGTLGTGPFMDDTSFEQMYRTPDGSEYEERGTDFKRVTVAAPAGKLGIVVDNPNGDVPVIVGVKETSVLHGRVHAGDVLISVDEVDCRGMSAMQVSKLISGRSHNPARTLVLGRSSAGC